MDPTCLETHDGLEEEEEALRFHRITDFTIEQAALFQFLDDGFIHQKDVLFLPLFDLSHGFLALGEDIGRRLPGDLEDHSADRCLDGNVEVPEMERLREAIPDHVHPRG